MQSFRLLQGGGGLTGSVIGVDLVNGGGGYTFPPFVEIEDECGGGYGATAKAVIDYDPDSPTYQQITDIYIVTEGENYTPPKDIPIDEDFILDDEKGPIIIDGGENYEGEDTVTDSNDVEYDIQIDNNGSITKLIPKIDNEYPSFADIVKDELLKYTVNSITGSGAKIAPRIKKRPIDPQGEVKQVIDCISKDDDFVGYVNGEKYYGPFHVHPTNGRKMVGATHVSTPHQYIYDSPEESLGSAQQIVSTTTQIQQVTGGGASATTSGDTPTTSTTSTTSGGTPAPTPTPTATPTPTPPPSSPPPSPPPSGGGGY